MGTAAGLEVVETTDWSGSMFGGGMRLVWQLDSSASGSQARDRRVLAASLRRLLDRWRATEREAAEREATALGEVGATAGPADAPSGFAEAITAYRAEHRRIFAAIRALTPTE